jgi:hypothetical protein
MFAPVVPLNPRAYLFSTHESGQQELLVKQLAAGPFEPHVVPIEKPFTWEKKLRAELEAAQNEDPERLIVFTDAWDVVYQQGPIPTLPVGHVLIAGEKNCWPDRDVQGQYPMGPTPWMFVNAGGIYGRAGDIAEVMEAYIRAGDLSDDQRFWTTVFLEQLYFTFPRLVIDYQCSLFQTLFLTASDEVVIQDGWMVNHRTRSLPSFLHWNGGSNWPQEILKKLGMV